MMTRRTLSSGLAGGLAAMLTGCGVAGRRESYRFRMTVEVSTPEGLKTGSSVFEESAAYGDFVLSETGKGKGFLRGEAVTVDLSVNPLFVLLELPDGKGSLGQFATQALTGGAPVAGFDDLFGRIRKLGGWFGSAEAELPRDEWPLMVRFRDLGSPRSVEKVDPNAIGVKRIVLEKTSDAVTSGIEKRLPWLAEAENFHYSGTAYGDIYPLPPTAFRSGTR